MKKFALPLTVLALAATPAFAVMTQTEMLSGTITPGNDQDYPILLFDANGVFTTAYLPVEQEAGESSFSVAVQVPVSQSLTEVVTLLSVYGGNGGTNDSPVSAVLTSSAAAAATATAAANDMNGPTTFSTTFAGANEVTIFNDLENGDAAAITDLENFVVAYSSDFVTLTDGYAAANVEAFSQANPGAATFTLAVPEPSSWWMLVAAAVPLIAAARLGGNSSTLAAD